MPRAGNSHDNNSSHYLNFQANETLSEKTSFWLQEKKGKGTEMKKPKTFLQREIFVLAQMIS